MRKGSHRSRNLIDALILLQCDAGDFNDRQSTGEAIADILRLSMLKVQMITIWSHSVTTQWRHSMITLMEPPEWVSTA